MLKNEMVAMLLAGGQGSRLGVLSYTKAKPGIYFGGRYRIIDFPLSNCINSGVDTVGVLTQYRPISLFRHIGIGVPWDLDRSDGGVTLLSPQQKQGEDGQWYTGTANAIYQNIEYLETYDPEYVLILSGDHIYKMDYSKMLAEHKKKKADVTIAVLEVTMEEASRFGIMNTNGDDDEIYEFEEKPKNPKSNLASMGIYIFSWKKLRKALIDDNKVHDDSDFGKHIIPYMLAKGNKMFAYRFNGYWKDVGTIESYWQSNMELIKTVPEFNLYEDFWKIYTKCESLVPQYTSPTGEIKNALIADGCEVYGTVINSVLGPKVVVQKGAVIKDSIIMGSCVIDRDSFLERCIVDEGTLISENVKIGVGENIENIDFPNIYNTGITVVGEFSTIPENVTIGKNCVIMGETYKHEYINDTLESGKTIIKVSEVNM